MIPIGVFLALWAALAITVETQIGRFLHRVMVKLPATALNRITRGHVIVMVILTCLGCLLAWLGGADGIRFFSMTVPDVAAWFATFEISAYLDATAAIIAASSLLRLNLVRVRLTLALARMFQRKTGGVRRHCNRREISTSAANDDDDDGMLALAG